MNRPYSFQRSIPSPISYASYKSREVAHHTKYSMIIPEWQLVDKKPDKLQKQKEPDLYVADWQMNN